MTKEELLQRTRALLLDLDGTVYLGDSPIGDMRETLKKLRDRGIRLVFFTNNSSKTEEEYRGKLDRMGLYAEGDGIFTSATATAEYLTECHAGSRVHFLATDAVKQEFARRGILLDDEHPEICVLAYDTTLDFEKMRRFDGFLRRGAFYIATHPDDVCPTADGSMPDVGSFIALFQKSAKRLPDVICGKPYESMARAVSRRLQIPCEQICMAGDRLHTDIRFANRNGMLSLLVLSGETTRELLSKSPDLPDVVLPSLNDLT